MIDSLKNSICIVRDNKIIAINPNLSVYQNDIERDFDYYFNAIVPKNDYQYLIADYSKPNYHNIVGFNLFPIMCSSLPDTYATILQYNSFAQLSENMIVLDLGAYSALSSIVFALSVGKNGKVISVEPDTLNYSCCLQNIDRFNSETKYYNIQLINGAIWHQSKNLYFSGEGCLGSHVIDHTYQNRLKLENIKGFTLYDLTKDLERLDFIKCDVEGAEKNIFTDDAFFDKFRPKIVIEPHFINGKLCIDDCINALKKYNYKILTIEQHGVSNIPLLECSPL